MIANAVLMSNQITGPYIQAHEKYHVECDDNITIHVILMLPMGNSNVACAHLALIVTNATALNWYMISLLMYMNAHANKFKTSEINIIYSTLETGDMKFKC